MLSPPLFCLIHFLNPTSARARNRSPKVAGDLLPLSALIPRSFYVAPSLCFSPSSSLCSCAPARCVCPSVCPPTPPPPYSQ